MTPSPPPLPITLLITGATPVAQWSELLATPAARGRPVQLFFLHHGLQQVADPAWHPLLLAGARAAFCAQGHTDHRAPRPLAAIQPAGLATLGQMIHDSALTITLPAIHWPEQPATAGRKRIRILPALPEATLFEALRLGAGLAGCDHLVTLHTATPLPHPLPNSTCDHVAALHALGARLLVATPPERNGHEVILEL